MGFEGQIDVEIDGNVGRIRMPRALLPPAHGGKDGWFALKALATNDREITATVPLNFLSAPKLRLDRISGQIEIEGAKGFFSGQCESYNPARTVRKF